MDTHILESITVLLSSNLNKSLLDQCKPTVSTFHSTTKCHKDIVLELCKTSRCNRQKTTTENHSQSKCRVVELSPRGDICRTLPHLRFIEEEGAERLKSWRLFFLVTSQALSKKCHQWQLKLELDKEDTNRHAKLQGIGGNPWGFNPTQWTTGNHVKLGAGK